MKRIRENRAPLLAGVLLFAAVLLLLFAPIRTRLVKGDVSIEVPYLAFLHNPDVYRSPGHSRYVWVQRESKYDGFEAFAALREKEKQRSDENAWSYTEWESDASEAFGVCWSAGSPRTVDAYLCSKATGRVWSLEFWSFTDKQIAESMASVELLSE